MGSESTTPPKVLDEKPQNSGSELVKPTDGNGQDAKGETLKETSPKSVFINSEPLREKQVQNAVKFLSHPKVRGTPVILRRSFLEEKGLTKEEIDEAFRLVPDPAPTVTSVQPTVENQDGQLKSSANMPTQVPTQTPQPAAAAPTGVVSTVASWSKSQFHWSHALLAVGLFAASGAGSALFFKLAVVPRLKSWIRKVVFEEEEEVDFAKKNNSKLSLAEEAAAAAKAAAAVAKASQEMLNFKSEEKKYFEAFRSLLDVQVEEMKSMSDAIRKLEATRDISLSSNKQTEGHTQTALWNLRPSSEPASMEPPVAPRPTSYMEIMAMVQRGEKPPGIRETNNLPSKPNQPPSSPQLAPSAKRFSSKGLNSTERRLPQNRPVTCRAAWQPSSRYQLFVNLNGIFSSTEEAVSEDRFPLSFYYRIADQLLDQAKGYGDEQRIHDLYTTLSRYCRIAKILPQHCSYMTYSSKEKLHHNKIYQDFIQELEMLKPVVGHDSSSQDSQQNSLSSIIERKVARFCTVGMKSLSSIRVYEEKTGLASVFTVDTTTAKDQRINVHKVTQSSPSPSLSRIYTMPYAGHVSHLTVEDSRHGDSNSSLNGTSESRVLQDVHISARLMEEFLQLARDNTDKDVETCGILGAFLKEGTFYVTTLIVPKQESTSSSCQALNEEEIYAVQNEQSLFPIGWIHTHPSQTCFMSSIDLHTHFPYQVMLPEAFAIVMAPTDTTRSYGIFRLTDPGGISVLKDCEERGFHSHQEPADGSPLYEQCSNVYINQNLRFEIFDLR